MADPSWLDDAPATPPKAPASKPPLPKPSPPPPHSDADGPAWLAAGGDNGGDEEPVAKARPPKPSDREPRGGAVIEVDVKSNTRAAAPATFMARMAQFEQHRQQRTEGGPSTAGAAPAPSEAGKKASKPRNSRKPRSNHTTVPGAAKCPTPPSDPQGGAHASPRRKPEGTLGENVGLSDVSRTQPVALNDFVPLSAEERQTYAKEISAFGHDTVARSRAPTFQLRLAALDTIRSVFDELYTVGPIPALEATIPVLARLVGDTVSKVATTACDAFEFVLSQALFITEAGLDQLQPLFRALCHQLRDGRSKVYSAAKSALLAAAAHDSIGPVPIVDELCTAAEAPSAAAADDDDDRAANALLATLRSAQQSVTTSSSGAGGIADDVADAALKTRIASLGANWKALGARLDVCYTFLQSYPSAAHGCTTGVMALGVAGLNCANSRVRRTAVVFVTEAYRSLREATEPYLRLVGAPNTMKLLREEIDVEIGDDGSAAAAAGQGGAPVVGQSDEAREEEQDMAAFDAEDTAKALSDEQKERVSFWEETIPHVKSLRCVHSSSWRLRRRVLDRILAHPLMFLARRTDEGALTYSKGPTEAESAATLAAARAKGLSFIDFERAAIALSQIVEVTVGQHIPGVAVAAFDLAAGVLYSDRWPAEQKRALGVPLTPAVLRFAAHDKVPDAAALAQAFLGTLASVPPAATVPATMATFALTTDAAVAKLAGKFVLPRTQCLQLLVDNYGTSSSGIDPDAVMTFAVDALRHAQSRVRRCAVDLVLSVYKAAGNVVQNHLSRLAGPILDEVRERIQAMAAKDRSRTAPSRRLATIVGNDQALAPEGSADVSANAQRGSSMPSSGNTGGNMSPERPATIGSTQPRKGGTHFARTQGTSLRQRMTEWREAQQADPSLCDVPSPSAPPPASRPKNAPSSASPSGVPPQAPRVQPDAVPNSAPGGPPPAGSGSAVFQAPPPQRKGKLIFA